MSSWKPRWYRGWERGRLKLSLTVYVHHYPTCSDRWVIRPEIIWDRK